MNEFDLTIIVPIYKVESYIQRCLESVIAQEKDGLRIECLLIDDCSPDKNMEVVQTVLDGYHGTISFTVLRHEHNRGLSAHVIQASRPPKAIMYSFLIRMTG